MVQSPSGADTSSDGQEINLILWDPKVYYHVDISSLPDHFPRKTILIYIFKKYFLTINFNIILRSMPKPSKWCPNLRDSKILYMFLISAMRNTRVRPFYLNFLHVINRMMFGEQCKL
jgi:hypothetical protein